MTDTLQVTHQSNFWATAISGMGPRPLEENGNCFLQGAASGSAGALFLL